MLTFCEVWSACMFEILALVAFALICFMTMTLKNLKPFGEHTVNTIKQLKNTN